MMANDPKVQIRQFVMENAQGRGITELGDNDSLIESGIVDSLGIFRLVSFLEETFGVKIGDEEIVNENFQTISDIERFLAQKQGQTTGQARATA
ncbi:MAG TPA: acyl carrier protein [Terriglobales bacterium]|jgi:acyl carrier protein